MKNIVIILVIILNTIGCSTSDNNVSDFNIEVNTVVRGDTNITFIDTTEIDTSKK